ncbi:uncharacterized protein MYCFIDRAFT_205518 [Pseudocercospora fijiensis CIRAD86]|uniref:Uncharacterized protein n=1 Tax=Pseudocercospora fijiensis (strain CIRAD86) TaxID=383855 RepID=M3AHR2_PSEFD|nr:uncharacterized protein MYCFIDRAFT_205518 [Pseudocercospora fijiensis CIRAD86]EME77052.1 hypothetical protein MYCFIDRAFT_205518 [Pseudocercospora fijiensis CIRAD86]
MRVGELERKACRDRVNQLRLGLGSTEFRQAQIDQFIETWAMESAVFRTQHNEFEDLVALWMEDIRSTGSCAWCIAAGRPGGYDTGIDGSEHARAHLDGRMPATR